MSTFTNAAGISDDVQYALADTVGNEQWAAADGVEGPGEQWTNLGSRVVGAYEAADLKGPDQSQHPDRDALTPVELVPAGPDLAAKGPDPLQHPGRLS